MANETTPDSELMTVQGYGRMRPDQAKTEAHRSLEAATNHHMRGEHDKAVYHLDRASMFSKALHKHQQEMEKSGGVKEEVENTPKKPRFKQVSCSQCGRSFGPADNGFSHCKHHKGLIPVPYRDEIHDRDKMKNEDTQQEIDNMTEEVKSTATQLKELEDYKHRLEVDVHRSRALDLDGLKNNTPLMRNLARVNEQIKQLVKEQTSK